MELETFLRSRQLCSYSRTSHNLWKLNVYYAFHKCPPPFDHILSRIDPAHSTPSYLSNIHFNIHHPTTFWSSQWSLSSSFPTIILYEFLFSPNYVTWSVHFILHYLIDLIMLDEEYNSRSSSLCSFLQSPVTWSLFGPNILLSTLFSNTLTLYSSNFNSMHPVVYHIKGKMTSVNTT
jgi:hypothetical protein